MREFLRRLGPRYGVSLGLTLVVVVIVAVAKLVPHSAVTSGVTVSNGVVPTLASGAPDDGLTSMAPPSPPLTSPGAANPQSVAISFATAWLHHSGVGTEEWNRSIVRYCTKQLAAQFAGVDPGDVPANRITGEASVVDYSAAYVQVNVPMDGGTLILGLRGPNGVWLVDSVDWNRD